MADCRLKIREQEEKILRVKQEYALSAEKDHEKAAAYAHQLVSLLDVELQAEWIAREEQHKKALETEKRQQERLAEYRKEYNKAWFDGDYALFVRYAEEALRIQPNAELVERVERAKERMRREQDRRKFEESIAKVKIMIADRHYPEARTLLEALKADATAPEQLKIVSNLFSRIFEEEDRNSRTKPDSVQSHTRITGFSPAVDPFFEKESAKRPEPKSDDDFFDNRAAQNKEKKNKSEEDKRGITGLSPEENSFFGNESAKRPEPKSDDDFFSNQAAQNKEKKNKSEEDKSGYALTDFDF